MLFNKGHYVLLIIGSLLWYVFGWLLMFHFLDPIVSDDVIKYHVIYFIHISMLVGAFTAFVGSKRLGFAGAVGKSLLYIGFALCANALGFFTWFISETLLGQSELYPAPADFFYVFFYYFVSIGVLYLLNVYRSVTTKFKLFQAFVLALLASSAMFFVFGLSFPSFEGGDTFLKSFFDVAYTFTDIILVAVVVVTLRLAGGKIFKGLLVFLLGLIVNVAADLVFFSRIESGTYYTGDVGDLLYAFSGLLLAIGIYFIARSFTLSTTEHNLPE